MSRTPKHARTQTDILDAAWALISERGADVSIADIASAAGISRQSVYLHFGSRSGLLLALVRRADERFGIKTHLFRAFEAAAPADRLREAIRAWFDFVPHIYPVARDLVRLRDTDPDAKAAWEDRMKELRGWFRQLVGSLERDGALAPGWQTEEAADYLWASLSVQMWGLLVSDCGWDTARVRQKLEDAVAATLLSSAAGA